MSTIVGVATGIEISHSDARSGSIVDDRIRPALESGSTVGSDKPVLLVIDEIDGATGAGENASVLLLYWSPLSHGRLPVEQFRSQTCPAHI